MKKTYISLLLIITIMLGTTPSFAAKDCPSAQEIADKVESSDILLTLDNQFTEEKDNILEADYEEGQNTVKSDLPSSTVKNSPTPKPAQTKTEGVLYKPQTVIQGYSGIIPPDLQDSQFINYNRISPSQYHSTYWYMWDTINNKIEDNARKWGRYENYNHIASCASHFEAYKYTIRLVYRYTEEIIYSVNTDPLSGITTISEVSRRNIPDWRSTLNTSLVEITGARGVDITTIDTKDYPKTLDEGTVIYPEVEFVKNMWKPIILKAGEKFEAKDGITQIDEAKVNTELIK